MRVRHLLLEDEAQQIVALRDAYGAESQQPESLAPLPQHHEVDAKRHPDHHRADYGDYGAEARGDGCEAGVGHIEDKIAYQRYDSLENGHERNAYGVGLDHGVDLLHRLLLVDVLHRNHGCQVLLPFLAAVQQEEEQEQGHEQVDEEAAYSADDRLPEGGELAAHETDGLLREQVDAEALLDDVEHLGRGGDDFVDIPFRLLYLVHDEPDYQRQRNHDEQDDGYHDDDCGERGPAQFPCEPEGRPAEQDVQGQGAEDAAHVGLCLTEKNQAEPDYKYD